MGPQLFPKEDTPRLKTWIVKRLENTSDADADVLADYVLALLQGDGDRKSIRKMCEEEIRDFLKEDDSSGFINDVFTALDEKLYLPPESRPPKPAKSASAAKEPPRVLGVLTRGAPSPRYPPGAPMALNGSKKRSYQDRLDGEEHPAAENQADVARATKQPRRSHKEAERGVSSQDPQGLVNASPGGSSAQDPATNLSHSPSAFYGTPSQFDPQNPGAFQFPAPFGFPGFPALAGNNKRSRKRCRHFDTKGYCTRGMACKFDHSVLPGMPLPHLPPFMPLDANQLDYDGNDPSFILYPHMPQLADFLGNARDASTRRRGDKSRRKPKGRPPKGGDDQAEDRPDPAALFIVNIPEENCTEEAIKEFFSQFGPVAEVSLRAQRFSAVVRFESEDAAQAAYASPKAFFDNRFVKAFWHGARGGGKSGGRAAAHGHATGYGGEEEQEPEIDMDEFRARQAEAQRVWEEKTRKREELRARKEELDRRQQELLVRQLEVKRKLEARLGGSRSGSASGGDSEMGEAGDGTSTADMLRAQLRKLEEEARILGLDPNAEGASPAPPGGGYRGRGGFRGRGSGARGGYGGSGGRGGYDGGYGDVHEAYAAYSLDNRPKRVAVEGLDFTTPEKDEALRRYLLLVGEFTALESTPDATHITFKERKTAESFLRGLHGGSLPGLEGKLAVTWVPNGTPNLVPTGATPAAATGRANGGPGQWDGVKTEPSGDRAAPGGGRESSVESGEVEDDGDVKVEMDYEVADDDHEWSI